MLTQKERMLAGELYNAADPALVLERRRARDLLRELNESRDEESDRRQEILRTLCEGATMTYFDEAAATWDNEPRRIALMKAVGETILREARPTKDMDVLDYGCGTGLVSLFLLPHVRSVTGADNSPGMLEVLQKKMAEGGIENMEVMHLNLEEGTVPSHRYHLIVTSMTRCS